MKAYSMDLRERVLKDCDGGLGSRAIAEKYSVSPAWVRRVRQRRREAGELGPRVPRRPPAGWTAHAERLRAAVRERPDATLSELRDRAGLSVGLTTVWRAVRALGLTLKKSAAGGRAGPAGCGCEAVRVAGRPARARPRAAGVPR